MISLRKNEYKFEHDQMNRKIDSTTQVK